MYLVHRPQALLFPFFLSPFFRPPSQPHNFQSSQLLIFYYSSLVPLPSSLFYAFPIPNSIPCLPASQPWALCPVPYAFNLFPSLLTFHPISPPIFPSSQLLSIFKDSHLLKLSFFFVHHPSSFVCHSLTLGHSYPQPAAPSADEARSSRQSRLNSGHIPTGLI